MPEHDLVISHKVPASNNFIWEFFFTLWTQVKASDIVPGEPLPVRWRVMTTEPPGREELYSIRILVDGVLVHSRDNVPAVSAYSSPFAISKDDGFQTETLVVGDAAVGRAVYRIGLRRLQIHVKSSAGTLLQSGSTRYRVRAEPVDGMWWEWTTPPFESKEWKSGYSLTGRMVNRCTFATLALTSLEFSEVRSEDEPGINPCDYYPVLVETVTDLPAGASSPVSFNRLHDWKWILSGVYTVTGPLNKTFACAVWFVCTDQFGNVYRGQCSTRRIRHVGVSKKKRLAAVGMQTAIANAVFWAATIFGWAIAAGWYGAAAALGEIAKDPPEPDSAYRTPVTLQRRVLTRAEPERWGSPTEATYRVLDSVAEIIALEDARTTARGRILGAVEAGDEGAADARKREFVELSRRMEDAAGGLRGLADEFAREVDDTEELDPTVISRTLALFASVGLPAEVREQMSRDGVDAGAIAALDAAARDESVSELAAANGVFARSFVDAVASFAAEARTEVDAVLAGETFVRVEQPGEGSEIRRRETGGCC